MTRSFRVRRAGTLRWSWDSLKCFYEPVKAHTTVLRRTSEPGNEIRHVGVVRLVRVLPFWGLVLSEGVFLAGLALMDATTAYPFAADNIKSCPLRQEEVQTRRRHPLPSRIQTKGFGPNV